MRILVFSSTYPPLIGGVETVTRRLVSELRGRDHEVTVVTNRYPRSLAPHEQLDGVAITRRLYPNILPSPGRRNTLTLVKQVLSLPLAAFELIFLYRLMRRFRPDIVNIHYFSYPALYALIAAGLARIPVVLCFHGSDVPGVPYPATYGWAARWASSLSHEIICCSSNLRSYLVHTLSQKGTETSVSVSHYGIDPIPTVDEKSTAETDPVVLLPARLVEKKAVDIAIRAMGKLRQRKLPVRLLIVGDGPLRAELENLARTLKVDDIVSFGGSVEHGVAQGLMSRAHFVIVPSYWEAFGMVCLEAMVAGKAVIGSRNGGIPEIVVDGETGLLVNSGDIDGLASAMASLLENPSRTEEMGRRGRDRVLSCFTWDAMLDRYEAAFQRATQGGRRVQ